MPKAHRLIRWLVCLWLPVLVLSTTAAELHGYRLVYQDTLRMHVDLDLDSGKPSLFTLENPHRLVIDLPDTVASTRAPLPPDPLGHVLALREGRQADGRLRLVLELDRAVVPTYRVVERQRERRLVIDLTFPVPEALSGFVLAPGDAPVPPYGDAARSPSASASTSESAPDAATEPAAASRPATAPQRRSAARDVIVAIDPGHGGRDSGARGRHGVLEKDVVLQIATRLYHVLDAIDGVRPMMTRVDDTYLGLGQRPQLAREAGADVFVSIHADAVARLGPAGSSVYALSLDGASSTMAAWLARSEKENARIHGGDVELGEIDPSLRETVLDLIQDHTLEGSIGLGNAVLAELEQIGPVHKREVEQAGFAVLKSPDIPSILVETAFISNPDEERKLQKPNFQQGLAEAIARGLEDWLSQHAPEGTTFASRRGAQ